MPWYRRFTRWMLRRQPRPVQVLMLSGEPTVEGFLIGRWAGCYVVALPQILDEKTGEPSDVLAGELAIPAGNVFAVLRLTVVAR